VAEAPGYAKIARTIRVAGAQKDVPVDFALVPNAGFVSIKSSDPKAAIAIDGKAMAFATWRGPLPAGRHYVQVYRDGFKQFEQAFVVEVGKTIDVDARLTPDDRARPNPATRRPPSSAAGTGSRRSPASASGTRPAAWRSTRAR